MTSYRIAGVALLASLLSFASRGGAEPLKELDCLIEPMARVTLSFPLGGLIETVRVDRGDLVRKGQILATMEAGVEKATVAIARARAEGEASIAMNRARLALQTRQLSRNSRLFKDNIISSRDLDDFATQKRLAEFQLAQSVELQRLARLQLRRDRATLRLRTLVSPIKGVVVERLLSPGEFSKQEPLLKLAQIHPLRVEVFVPIEMLGKVRVGDQAFVVPEKPVKGNYQARVTVVDQVVDASSGTFGVRLELPNPRYRLPAGLKCKIRFTAPVAVEARGNGKERKTKENVLLGLFGGEEKKSPK